MNLLSSPARPARGALAVIYPTFGPVQRVALRRTQPASGPERPEQAFIRWFNRQAAANPGYALRIRNILFITPEPLCASCRQSLLRFLDRQQLADRVRLQSLNPAVPAQCRCQAPAGRRLVSGLAPADQWATGLDELLGELEAPSDNDSSRRLYQQQAPLPPDPTPAELAAEKARRERAEQQQLLEEEKRRQEEEQQRINQLAQRWKEEERQRQARLRGHVNRNPPIAPWQTAQRSNWQKTAGTPGLPRRPLPPLKARPVWQAPVTIKTP